MSKYKIEFIKKEIFCVDILAENEKDAEKEARERFDEILENGMSHYYQTGDPEIETNAIYDVSNTDDPFDPIQNIK